MILQLLTIGGREVLVFQVGLQIPPNTLNTSRENAARMALAKRLEGMTLVQLDEFLQELTGLLSIDTEWPVCLADCGTRSILTMPAAEVAMAVRGQIEFLKKNPPSAVRPAATPAVVTAGPSSLKTILFWGGAAVAVALLVKQFGGTSRA